MKKSTKNILRIVISIIYIAWGIYAPMSAIQAILALDVAGLISAAAGILTLIAGISGLIGLRRMKCRFLGVIIFIIAALGVAAALPEIAVNSLVSAVLAWLFIICM